MAGTTERVDGVVVSVIIPARDEEALIGEALASVVAQTYPLAMIECIVVDNASSDGTARAVAIIADQHREPANQVLHEPKIGVATAKNRGAREAKGTVLVFMDGDSRMQPGLIHDVAASYRRGLLAGSIKVIADSRDWLDRGFFALMELGKILFGIRTQMAYCDREVFLSVGGFRPELSLAEDLDFLTRTRDYLRERKLGAVTHLRSSAIATSPRRLRRLPCRLSMFLVFGRWALAFAGIGREREY